MLDQTAKQLLYFTRASEFEDVPDVPGNYAWFLSSEGDDTGSLKDLLDSLLARLANSNQLTVAEGESEQHRIRLQRTIPESFDRENLPELSAKFRI